MRDRTLRPVWGLALCGLLPIFALIGSAHAADFPSRPVEITINFAPGGIVDTSIRLMTEELSKNLGVPVVVINRSGGGGAVGAQYVMSAEPDGYTVLASATGVFNIVPLLNPGLSYKLSDFIPLARYATSLDVILVRKDSPFEKFEDLVSYAKKNPGKLTCGDAGIGTASDFMLEMLKLEAGISFVNIPYKGGGELNTALMGGHIDFTTNGIAAVQGLVKSGQFRALAVNANERSANLPDVPSLKELGYGKSVLRIGVGYFLAKGTPKSNVDKLASDFERAIKSPAVKKNLENLGIIVDYEDGPTFALSLADQYKVLEEVGKKAKLIK
jgi:tripartite-type tricarboxylate transporter receptor subunit TctC